MSARRSSAFLLRANGRQASRSRSSQVKIMSEIIFDLRTISNDTKNISGKLSAEQINWKPSETGWSVGQCFEHLIKSNELFYGELDKIADGTRRNSFLESYSPLSGFWANLLINSLKKDSRKFKAPTQKIVPPSEIDARIVEKFVSHQAELIGKIKRIESADWNKIKITSPFMSLMTYRLSDGFQVIVEHEKRHFRQAERVIRTDGFPK
jgi:DinB superfamily